MDDNVGIANPEKDECNKKSVIEKMLEIYREGLKDPTITQGDNYLGITEK